MRHKNCYLRTALCLLETSEMGKKMNELEPASKLIGDIYDAALNPVLWPSVFESTCIFLQGCNAAMCVHESGAGRWSLLLQWGFDPSLQKIQ